MDDPAVPGPSSAQLEQYNITVNNSFSELSDMENMETDERLKNRISAKKRSVSTRNAVGFSGINASKKQFLEVNKDISVQVNKFEFKMPPIKVYNINAKELNCELSAKLNKRYCIKNVNKDLSIIHTDNLDDFNVCIESLLKSKKNYFTHTPTELKPINILLKNIHISYTEEDVSDALLSLKFLDANTKIIKVNKFSTLKSKRENRALSIYIVQLSPLSQIKELTDIKYLLNQHVKWEKPDHTDMVQCYRCQRFNHTAKNCQMQFRCVKCKTPHEYGQCQTDKLKAENENERKRHAEAEKNGEQNEEIIENKIPDPSCVNCGQVGHPANYRKCPKYKSIMERRNEKIFQEQQHQQEVFEHKLKSYNNLVHPNKSYASAVGIHNDISADSNYSKNKNSSSGKGNAYTFMDNECKNMFGEDLFSIINKIQEFIPHYKNITEKKPKQMALFQFIFELIDEP